MSDEATAVLNDLRRRFERLSPLLSANDWSCDDIEEINALVLEHRDANNLPGLHACLAWMEVKLFELQQPERVAYAAEQAKLVAVQPAVGSLRKAGGRSGNSGDI